jgi:polyferredoxin
MNMIHPGLPMDWAQWVIGFMMFATLWVFLFPVSEQRINQPNRFSFQSIPLLGQLSHYFVRHSGLLLFLKLLFAAIFLLVIVAGLWGSVIPERNLATSLTWNLWWGGIVIAIVFSGSAWCALCPWDTLASLLVKNRLWQRSKSNSLLQLTVPKSLRNLWPATLLFVGLSWLELGVGVTTSPYATALMAIMMLLLAVTAMVLFKDKAFCRYFCPVGRTVGVYSQLSPVALRPVDNDICDRCDTLECYHGSLIATDGLGTKGSGAANIDACPTRLVMGRLQESTYCTSCGNCTQSCPSDNINWAIRAPSVEAIHESRPHRDEAFFMLTLLFLTSFHGLSMLDGWQQYMIELNQVLGAQAPAMLSFTIALTACWLLPITAYSGIVKLCAIRLTAITNNQLSKDGAHQKIFSSFAFIAIPLAFSYHIAHNLNHLLREANDWPALVANPLGTGALPLSMMEKHQRHSNMWMSQELLFSLQAGLLILGFYLALQVIRHRAKSTFESNALTFFPMVFFAITVTAFNLWLLMQDMVMRM